MGEEERWLPVVGYEGSYEVSDRGRVRSLDRFVTYKDGRVSLKRGRSLKGRRSSHGYTSYYLPGRGSVYGHVIVLESFVGHRPLGLDGCHNDGDPSNNALGNLRWDTRGANIRDAIRHGTHYAASKTHCPRGHVLCEINCTQATLDKGGRDCLACNRARARVGYHPELKPEIRAIADDYYRKIMEGAPRGQ